MKSNSQELESKPALLSPLLASIGPGILFAAGAVGVSHLVQATRAGAMFGLGMLSIIVIACLVKYPAIRFGGEYTAKTGKTLIQSYRQTGMWALVVYGIAQVLSMVFVVAAVCLVTVGLIKAAFGLQISDIVLVILLLVSSIAFLVSGRYHLLEKISKVIVPVFTVLILAAVVITIGKVDWSVSSLAWPELSVGTIMFIVALGGFMPSPVEASVLQSLWTKAKADETGRLPTAKEARFDFNVGFVTTLVLALSFMILGAGIMHGADVQLAKSAGGFAVQVINLFTSTIGDWSFPIICAAAITVMLSTTLTLLDGYPRVAEAIVKELSPNHSEKIANIKTYDFMIVVVSICSVGVLLLFMKSFAMFIDLTSVLVFILGPILAYLNHRAMFGNEIPESDKPSSVMEAWSIFGIVVMVLVSLVYLFFRFS